MELFKEKESSCQSGHNPIAVIIREQQNKFLHNHAGTNITKAIDETCLTNIVCPG